MSGSTLRETVSKAVLDGWCDMQKRRDYGALTAITDKVVDRLGGDVMVVPPGSAIIDAEDVSEARRIVAGWDDGTLDDRNTARQAVALLRRIGGEG